MTFDVIVIGGSLAGAACAHELRRRGIAAVAFERDHFPRAKVCGGFLSANAVECLAYLDVLQEVRTAGAITVDRACIRAGGLQVEVPLRRSGLGISRTVLDDILARSASVRQGIHVHDVVRTGDGFLVQTNQGEFRTPILVDAAGKLSRFTIRSRVPEFGIQHLEAGSRGSILDFWFFPDGYGGAVSVENGFSNFCFLIRRDALRAYIRRPNQLRTGPLAYESCPNGVIAIGDASGMIDPFCGEGMHHALDSGIVAAKVIATSLGQGKTYAEIQQIYQLEHARRWSRKRLLAGLLRRFVWRPDLIAHGLRWNPGWFLDRLWDKIPA